MVNLSSLIAPSGVATTDDLPQVLSETQVTDNTSTVSGTVSGQRLGQSLASAFSGAPGAPPPFTVTENLTTYPLSVSAGNLNLPIQTYVSALTPVSGTTSSTFVSAGTQTITALATGVMRFSMAITNQLAGGTEGRILKNGTEIAILNEVTANSGGSSATLTVDAAAAEGDVFEYQVRRSSGGGFSNGAGRAIKSNTTVTTRAIPVRITE